MMIAEENLKVGQFVYLDDNNRVMKAVNGDSGILKTATGDVEIKCEKVYDGPMLVAVLWRPLPDG